MFSFEELISRSLSLPINGVRSTVELLHDGATMPFISRYRKEATGGLDEVQISAIQHELKRLQELDARRQAILAALTEAGKLTDELRKSIESALTMTELEDIYLPYRSKRKTRAQAARERGLEPLADFIWQQGDGDVYMEAALYLNDQVAGLEEALQGARDIIAERISEDAESRQTIRTLFEKKAAISSHVMIGKQAEGIKFKDYYDWKEPLASCPSHRLLAMRRGETEGFLRVEISPPEDDAIGLLKRLFVRGSGDSAGHVLTALGDSYARLLGPAIETEFKNASKEAADTEAIRVFTDNLRQLLLAPPLGQKRVLALDPGFRTGCKVVCLDAQGALLHHSVIYPHPPQEDRETASSAISAQVQKYRIEAIAIGNGTAGRETESFVRDLKLGAAVQVFMVAESGASIYSASDAAREEFPSEDVTVRGAVSIGRRLMDPLAELVKIDPKSIGVGQYQHDVDQNELKESLDETVVSCVNSVGVNLNNASKHLLMYVSGLGPQLAKNIVDHRDRNGPFSTRASLRDVPRLGDKAFEQCAGFLRIPDAKHPLDNSAVHPESYGIVEQMASDAGSTVPDLIRFENLRKKINLHSYVTDQVGLPTLTDIMAELAKPGRDPREALEAFSFDDSVHTMADLQVGMKLPGIVTNITNFGAFVDIGVKQDGLVHISQLSDRYVSSPGEVVKLRQQVQVRVVEIDLARKRIQLSMKDCAEG
ncbi:RNA-binding transcriptional accessory protein [Candidatus Wirthbacteria bacterium CG2_30_54_11]|uniref:RNA-binding transcriptional accessory protein n=1 Tax=Candidatus Wirthbacteria bacterium CG2_30_54_11 TaxID=1817892 RepID=A0A1J5IKR8_9BACT|nr:MAG: RNA-binding transcriptional accessory protein [Candidatus Wirthbacteria bacterium CG2_30_54_11]